MYSVLNTLSEYIYFYVSNILLHALLLLVSKTFENLQCRKIVENLQCGLKYKKEIGLVEYSFNNNMVMIAGSWF